MQQCQPFSAQLIARQRAELISTRHLKTDPLRIYTAPVSLHISITHIMIKKKTQSNETPHKELSHCRHIHTYCIGCTQPSTKPVKVQQLQAVWLYRSCPLSTHTDMVTSTGKTTHVHIAVSDKAHSAAINKGGTWQLFCLEVQLAQHLEYSKIEALAVARRREPKCSSLCLLF